MPKLASYRNQSFDLQGKSIDWFLYDGNIGITELMSKIFGNFFKRKHWGIFLMHYVMHYAMHYVSFEVAVFGVF